MAKFCDVAEMRRTVVVSPAPILRRPSAGAGAPGRDGLPGTGADIEVSSSAMPRNVDESGVVSVKWSVCGRELEGGREEYGTAFAVNSPASDLLVYDAEGMRAEERTFLELASGLPELARLIPSEVARALIDELTVEAE